MCIQFLHMHPVFTCAPSFLPSLFLWYHQMYSVKNSLSLGLLGRDANCMTQNQRGKKNSPVYKAQVRERYSYWNLLHTNDHWIMVNRKIWKKLKFLWIKHSCLMILQMVSHTTINIPMKGHVHGQFSDMNETTKHIKVLTKYLWMTSLPMSSALTMALSPTTLPP